VPSGITSSACRASVQGVLTTESDLERRAALRRMKAVPLALLIAAAIIFAIGWYFEKQPDSAAYWGFIRAAAEAGMVGGLADWFAVTAIFRHPLGIPIPHTALIPTKKDQLGTSLADFVQHNFLNPDVVRGRIATMDPASRIGEYIDDPANRAWLVGETAAAASAAVRSIDDVEAQTIVRNLLFEQAAAYAWAPPAGKILGALVADDAHQTAVETVFRVARQWLVHNEATIVNLIADRGPAQGFFLARAAHEAVGKRVYTELLTWLDEAITDPRCPTRLTIDRWLMHTSQRLREDPELISRVERFKQQVLSSGEVHEAVASVWPTTKRIALEALGDPNSELRRWFDGWIAGFGRRLGNDPDFRAQTSGRIEAAAAWAAERYGSEMGTLISDTVARWDATEASERIELQVGKDLQFIRINGTVVGALAGLVIHSVGTLILS
jgi:uncharacterized membrane-anchored protein YjiN (DUF445 family)